MIEKFVLLLILRYSFDSHDINTARLMVTMVCHSFMFRREEYFKPCISWMQNQWCLPYLFRPKRRGRHFDRRIFFKWKKYKTCFVCVEPATGPDMLVQIVRNSCCIHFHLLQSGIRCDSIYDFKYG